MNAAYNIPGRWAAWIVILLLPLGFATGCKALALGYWVANPYDTEAEFSELEGKRVAIVCRGIQSLDEQTAGAAAAIAKGVSRHLAKNVPDADVVSQKEINNWTDHNELTSLGELGKSMEADYVVAVDLDHFSVYRGATLYQGRAEVRVTVHEVESGETDDLDPIDSVYPKNAVPADSNPGRFRRKYVAVLSGQIARRFYDHDSKEVFTTDNFYRE